MGIRKIQSGKNITFFNDQNKPYMFMCGTAHNDNLFEFLSMCEDEEKIKKVIENKAYENYIKTYREYPVNVDIFDHGHVVSYIAVDDVFEFPAQNKKKKEFFKVTVVTTEVMLADEAFPYVLENRDAAVNRYIAVNGDQPKNIIVCCKACKKIVKIINLEDNSISDISTENIINV